MSFLENMVTEYLDSLSGLYFLRQYAVIICMFVFGGVFVDLLFGKGEGRIKRAVLAFPTGMAVFVITAYAMLTFAVPYNTRTVCAAVLAELATALFLNRKSYTRDVITRYMKGMLAVTACALAVAGIATSGIAPVAISNDSMYFFRRYPDSIVYFEGLRDQFDFWLTDTGLGIVSVDTLPALFGFGETFGIREFFHIDFLVFFGSCVYDRAAKRMPGRGALAAAGIITLFLAMATPFVILGHWALANMYFMEMFFMAAYTAFDRGEEGIGVPALLLIALSLFRIEGTIFVAWLVLCISLYTGLGRKLAVYVMLPMTVLFASYCLRLFVGFDLLVNLYLFLTPRKAIMLTAMMVFAGLYIAFIEPLIKERFPKLAGFLSYAYIAALLAGNVMLFVLDRKLYTGNLNAFCANLFRQSGWGMLPYFVISMSVLLAAEYLIKNIKGEKPATDKRSNGFNITVTLGFLLLVMIAAFGRGDILAENVGDSGNRVLLQIVPLVVLTFGELFLGLYEWKGTKG